MIMVILHIANIDPAILGGVQVAVPWMVQAQSAYATVGLMNTNGTAVPGVTMVRDFEAPFDRPSLVVFHELYRPEFLRISKDLKKKGIPYVIVPHGGMTRQAQKRKALKKIVANRLLFRSFFEGAVAIQYLSEKEAERSKFRLKHIIFGNGIPMPAKHKESFHDAELKLLYIGRMEVQIKGLDLLIEAVAQCAGVMRENNCRLYLYGPDCEGQHEQLQKLMEKYAVADMITLSGPIVGADKERELLSADCFIQTSRSEGMPMGILEALSYGLPCIVTNGTGVAGIVTERAAGYGCDTTVRGISEAICQAIADRADLQKMSAAAEKLAQDQFDQCKIAEKTVDMYGKLI